MTEIDLGPIQALTPEEFGDLHYSPGPLSLVMLMRLEATVIGLVGALRAVVAEGKAYEAWVTSPKTDEYAQERRTAFANWEIADDARQAFVLPVAAWLDAEQPGVIHD